MATELIINIVFSSVMVVLGILAIWIVKWSTDRMTRVAVQTSTGVVFDPESLLPIIRRLSSGTLVGEDAEAGHPLEMMSVNISSLATGGSSRRTAAVESQDTESSRATAGSATEVTDPTVEAVQDRCTTAHSKSAQ